MVLWFVMRPEPELYFAKRTASAIVNSHIRDGHCKPLPLSLDIEHIFSRLSLLAAS